MGSQDVKGEDMEKKMKIGHGSELKGSDSNKCPQCGCNAGKLQCSCGFWACLHCSVRCTVCDKVKCRICYEAVLEAFPKQRETFICFDCRLIRQK